ncbi:MAG: AMP-binding protein, partial [Flammeovirgaceae bacterium]
MYVPIDPSTPELRSLRILQDTCCSILVSQTGSTVSAQSNVSVITLHDLPDAVTDIRFLTANDPSRAAYIIYTSGSTGVPKGAIVAHRGMMNHIEAKIADLKINESSIIAQNASISFDISIWQMMAALVRGASVHIVDQGTILEPGKFLCEVTNVGVTHLEVVPSYLSALLDHAEYQSQLFFTNLHFMIATGEALVQNLVERWFSCYPSIPMVNAYGPTEAS